MPESERVCFKPVSVVDVPFGVLADAFWAPQAAKLHSQHKRARGGTLPTPRGAGEREPRGGAGAFRAV